jgi:hypothetical protein
MTSQDTRVTPLSDVDEWLRSLTDEQVAFLRMHRDTQNLPTLVVQLLRTGPLSPMQVSAGNGRKTTHMPEAIKQALA